MRRHLEKRILPYTAEQMYALVADVEHYPTFLPWCLGAEITRKNDKEMTAILQIGWKGLRDAFVSHVALDAPHAIVVTYGGGPLKHLENEWRFSPLPDGRCEVTFFVAFDFKSVLLGTLMDLFFDSAFCKMVGAFEERATEIYPNKEENHD
ncbi:MAG: type II toxin-antitoxin system RatA family toxin [Alphaproteobacteria bacterium]|nr:type II toxin-antitoxin system RatA family toxin [Alphaproteobacteria bacterium]